MTNSIHQMTQLLLSHEAIEYGTPAHIVELARSVMGSIDLDPASDATFNQTVKATRYLTAEQNGLRYNWRGNVWLNPPYSKTNGKSNQAIWAAHLEKQYQLGNVNQACLLIRAALGYNWFEDLWRRYPCCVLRDRLCFIKPNGTTDGQAKYANAVLYLGCNYAQFVNVFALHGRILFP